VYAFIDFEWRARASMPQALMGHGAVALTADPTQRNATVAMLCGGYYGNSHYGRIHYALDVQSHVQTHVPHF
jgi:hypothetical protein